MIQDEENDSQHRSVRPAALALLLCAFYLVWTIWAILLVKYPSLDRWPIRLAVRIAVWGGVAVAYSFLGANWIREIRFNRRGVMWGLIASIFCIARLVWQCMQKHSGPVLPDIGTILNAIVAGPLLEEIVFRAIVFREVSGRLGLLGAAFCSAILFALIHLPYWWIAHTMPPDEIVFRLGGIFLLGIVLALIYRASRTLISPIILHVLNNVASLAAP